MRTILLVSVCGFLSASLLASDSLLEIKHITSATQFGNGTWAGANTRGKYEVPKGRYAIVRSSKGNFTYINLTALMHQKDGLALSPLGPQELTIKPEDLPYTLPSGAVITFNGGSVGSPTAVSSPAKVNPDLVVHEYASQTALEIKLSEMEKRKNELEAELLRLSNATNVVIMRQLLADHITQDLEKMFGQKIAALEQELRTTNKRLDECLAKQGTSSSPQPIKQ